MENFELLGATDDAVANLIAKMQEMGFDQAPAMFEGVIRKIALDGMIGMTSGVMFACLFILFMCSLFKGCTIECNKKDERDGSAWIIVGTIGGFVSLISTIINIAHGTIIKFLDPEAWFYMNLFNKLL